MRSIVEIMRHRRFSIRVTFSRANACPHAVSCYTAAHLPTAPPRKARSTPPYGADIGILIQRPPTTALCRLRCAAPAADCDGNPFLFECPTSAWSFFCPPPDPPRRCSTPLRRSCPTPHPPRLLQIHVHHSDLGLGSCATSQRRPHSLS